MKSIVRAVAWTAIGAGVVTGAGAFARGADVRAVSPAPAPATGDVTAWVDRNVAECAPKPEERRFDRTGWLTSIRPALALAKEHNRPVFLFTHDGRMGLGRC